MMKRLLPVLSLLAFAAPAFADAGVKHWTVNPVESKIAFKGTQMGTEFTGSFPKFAPDINFDPDHLDKSSVKVAIDIASISTGDKDRDTGALAKEWFDSAAFPLATFESHTFKKTGADSFEADGTLTIKNIALPLHFPFTLDFKPINGGAGTQAHMKADIPLDRSKFSLGTGQWADTSVIANNVTVTIDLTAGAK